MAPAELLDWLLETIRTFVYTVFLCPRFLDLFSLSGPLLSIKYVLFPYFLIPWRFYPSTKLRIVNSFEILPEKSYIIDVVCKIHDLSSGVRYLKHRTIHCVLRKFYEP